MFLFGDLARTTQLLHSSDIGELMAEPPVAGRARKLARATAPVTEPVTARVARLVPSPEIDGGMAEGPAVTAPTSAPKAAKLPRDRQRAAA